MLVLTRKTNDTIVIDGRIRIEVLQVRKGGIRIGITAPDDVRIRRGELAPLDLEAFDSKTDALETADTRNSLLQAAQVTAARIETSTPEIDAPALETGPWQGNRLPLAEADAFSL